MVDEIFEYPHPLREDDGQITLKWIVENLDLTLDHKDETAIDPYTNEFLLVHFELIYDYFLRSRGWASVTHSSVKYTFPDGLPNKDDLYQLYLLTLITSSEDYQENIPKDINGNAISFNTYARRKAVSAFSAYTRERLSDKAKLTIPDDIDDRPLVNKVINGEVINVVIEYFDTRLQNYDPNKRERDKTIYFMCIFLDISYEEVGKCVGLSRQRIAQILKSHTKKIRRFMCYRHLMDPEIFRKLNETPETKQ